MDKLLLYELTFYLCTPDSLKLFIQTWFLSVDVAEISPASINIIKFDKDWLFATLFHYGNIYIFTDSEVRIDLGSEITLEDIPEPEIMVKRIYKIYDRKFPTE